LSEFARVNFSTGISLLSRLLVLSGFLADGYEVNSFAFLRFSAGFFLLSAVFLA
jgi:hypothetical protein